MLSPLGHIAWMIRRRRRALGWTQRRVAAGVGCSQSYLAQVETGVRPVSRQFAEKLEGLLGVERGLYRRAPFQMGRPRLSPQTRSVMKQIRRSRGMAPQRYLGLGRPHHPRVDRVRGLVAEGAGKVPPGQDQRFWRWLNEVRFDSKCERNLNLTLADHGQLVRARPQSLGCGWPVVDGVTGRAAGDRPYPAFFWREGDMAVACFPQRCVRTPGGYRWPDLLVVVAAGGRRVTGAVEVDGRPWHEDKRAEAFRDAELEGRVLHLDAWEVGRLEVVDRIVEWARGLVSG